tara:strand:- start:51 stop:293 length:243 start_codon:yes stop_codon:yes gene_type:complete
MKKTKKKENMTNLSFDINLTNKENQMYRIEITENYENDKFHVVVFETDDSPYPDEHYTTLGFKTEKQVFVYLKQLQNLKQ